MTIEQTLADARENVAVLRQYGQKDIAVALEAMLDKLADPLREYLRRIALEHRGNAEAAREAGRRARSA